MSYTRRYPDCVLPTDHKPASKRLPYQYDYDGKEPVRAIVPVPCNACEKHNLEPCPECGTQKEGKL
jgi:hypothetical protein